MWARGSLLRQIFELKSIGAVTFFVITGLIFLVISLQLSGLKQISSPNIAQTSFVSEEYVPIVVQPLDKTKRHRCTKCF